MENKQKGFLVVIEGFDYSGKTTICKELETLLPNFFAGLRKLYPERFTDLNIKFTREPGGTAMGAELRRLVLNEESMPIASETEALIYAASRAQFIDEFLYPSIASGDVVITDRFIESSYIYQGIIRGLGVDKISGYNNFTHLKDVYQDAVCFVVSIPYEVSKERQASREKLDRLDKESDEFHKKAHQLYEELNNKAYGTESKYVKLDGTKPPIENAKIILEAILSKYKKQNRP